MKNRTTELSTGRGGARLYYTKMLKKLFKATVDREPIGPDLIVIEKKVNSTITEHGIYSISDGKLTYQGLHEIGRPDGVHACKVEGRYYIEVWYEEWRKAYKIVDETEYERLKTIDPDDFDFITYFNLDKDEQTTN